ncbi:unnamed protein product, partial [Rotaria sp. Silwood2]
ARNEKCVFRRGQVYLNFSNFEQAIKDFQTALKINPSNVAAQQQIQHCQQQKIKQNESYKAFFNDTSKPGLFDADEKYKKEEEKMMGKNALRSLGLEPISLESLNIRKEKPSNN